MGRLFSIAVVFILYIGLAAHVYAADKPEIESAMSDTADCVYRAVKNPQLGSIGGEWAVLGLARSGYDVPRSYYESYYKEVESYVKERNGLLDTYKYTEYSRVIIGLTAAGFDPRNVGGCDLTTALGDFEGTIRQGVNGPAFALIALDSSGYDIPLNENAATQATREMYITEILHYQLADGGFVLNKADTFADADITGMVLQALAKYQDRAEVKEATVRALDYLAEMQGGINSWESESPESIVQIVVALCELGISVNDPRFVKDGKTPFDQLMEYYVAGKGFKASIDGSVDQMATEQALIALAAIYRMENGLPGLYDLVGVRSPLLPRTPGKIGLPGKHEDVKIRPLTTPVKSFADIAGHDNQNAIEILSARGIVSGKSETRFDPGMLMTRAEFAAVITRGLGLTQNTSDTFEDVRLEDWFSGYVETAHNYGIVNGTSAATFNPNGIITREEAAAMTARAAELCGMNMTFDDTATRNMLAQFGDYVTVSDWARNSMAFCYRENILSQEVFLIMPKEAVSRGEIAEMVYRMLNKAELL